MDNNERIDIAELRRQTMLTLADLSRITKIAPSHLSKLERGKHRMSLLIDERIRRAMPDILAVAAKRPPAADNNAANQAA